MFRSTHLANIGIKGRSYKACLACIIMSRKRVYLDIFFDVQIQRNRCIDRYFLMCCVFVCDLFLLLQIDAPC